MAVPEVAPSGVPAQLSVRCGREAVGFYDQAFGAKQVFRFGGDAENEEVVAQLATGDTHFWVEDESPEHYNFSPESLGGASERMLLVVDDPAAVMGRALAAGAKEVHPVEEAHGWVLGPWSIRSVITGRSECRYRRGHRRRPQKAMRNEP